ncbi:MAG: FtsX-like permease family protein, partial [Anaerolineae bacterium]
NDLYFNLNVNGVQIDPSSLVKGLFLGIGSALLAAALPAAEAGGVPAVTVLQRSDLELRVRRAIPMLNKLALVLILVGGGVLLFIPNVIASFGGIFAGLFGITLLIPGITVALMRFATATVGRLGLLGRMAARTVIGALSRTSVAIAALMVAISVTIGVGVMIASFRATVVTWLDQTFTADFFIDTPSPGANTVSQMDPAVIDRIRAVPGVQEVEILRNVYANSPELGSVHLYSASPGRQRDSKEFRYTLGSAQETWRQFDLGGILITEPFANRRHLSVGQEITLLTDHGPKRFPIVGITFDYSSDQGYIFMSLDRYRENWDDRNISGAAAWVVPGVDVEKVGDDIRHALSGELVVVESNQALRNAALVVFDRTFAITATLRFIAVVVAFIGILSALMALQLERTRELATLRATGMTIRQLWQLTLLESGLMGATAGILSIPTGLLLAAVLIYVINLRSFGWTIFFTPVPETYLEALAVSVIAALLAAVYPMIRLGKLETAEALREE